MINILPIQQLLQSQNAKWWEIKVMAVCENFDRQLTGFIYYSTLLLPPNISQTSPDEPHRSLLINFMNLDSYHPRQKRSAEKNPQSCIWWLFFPMKFCLVFKNHKICMIWFVLSCYIHPNRCLSVEHTAFTQSGFGLRLTESKFRLHLNLYLSWNAYMIFFFFFLNDAHRIFKSEKSSTCADILGMLYWV